MAIRVKRAYEKPETQDGYRVLVDRLWPRGLAKEAIQIDAWLREIAPSDELRRWFNHDPGRWSEFKRRYFEELEGHPREVEGLIQQAREGQVTLVYAAKDERFNNAVALREYLGRESEYQAQGE